MDIEQLEAFSSIARTRNFTKSAQLLHVAQSTISAKIQALEEMLGATLFNRTNRSVSLTAAGRSFLPYAERMVALATEGKMALQDERRFQATLVIGGHGSLWAYGLLPRLQSFRKHHPEVALHLITGYAETITQHIIDGVVDVGVVYFPPANGKFEIIPLLEEELVLVGRDDPGRPIQPEDLRSREFIHVDWGDPFSPWFENLVGRNYLPGFMVDNASVVLRLLFDGGSFSFMLKSIAQPYIDKGALRALTYEFSPPPRRPVQVIYLASRKSHLATQLGLHLLRVANDPRGTGKTESVS